MTTQLSANFHLAEFTHSQNAARLGITNIPAGDDVENLKRLCTTVLQPLRNHLKRAIIISSGYRSPALNRAIGGSGSSAHMDGRAADIHVPGLSVAQLQRTIHDLNLPVDQVIDEFSQWVHVGISVLGRAPRGQYLCARIHGGQTLYLPSRGF